MVRFCALRHHSEVSWAQAFGVTPAASCAPSTSGRVTLAGWVHRRRDHGPLVFFDLRDRYGLTQVVTNRTTPEAHAVAEPARNEWVVQVEGVVRQRPEGTANAELATGEVEVAVDRFTVLNPSKVPPFYINEEQPGLDESLRLEYRYLDLRRPRCRHACSALAAGRGDSPRAWMTTASSRSRRRS